MFDYVVDMKFMSSFSIIKPGMEDKVFKGNFKSDYFINYIIFAVVPFIKT